MSVLEPTFTVSITRKASAMLLVATGEVDMLTAPQLRGAVDDAFDDPDGAAAVVIDMTGVTFLGSSGLAALLDATDAASSRDRSLRLVVGDQRQVLRPIQVTGLGEVLALYDTLDDALR